MRILYPLRARAISLALPVAILVAAFVNPLGVGQVHAQRSLNPIGAGQAHARRSLASGQAKVIIPLTLDCGRLTEEGKQYVRTEHLCNGATSNGVSPDSGVSPDGLVAGACGSVDLELNPGPYLSGYASIYLYIVSYQGAMSIINYNVYWYNSNNGSYNGNWGGIVYPNSGVWGNPGGYPGVPIYTTAGQVYAQLTHMQAMTSKGWCTALPNFATALVT